MIRNETSGHLEVIVHPGIGENQELYIRVRNGGIGVLNCAQETALMNRIDGAPLAPRTPDDGARFDGIFVDSQAFNNPYDDSWLEGEPTAEMLAAAEAGLWTIDLCLMEEGELVRGAEMDVMRALDRKGTGKFDGYGDADEQISSVSAYAEACVNQLGEIPFFSPLEDGDYTTFSCLDATPIPMTVTDAEGNVTYPEEIQPTCDNPQYIYSSCEPNAVTGRTNGPRVTSAMNDRGTHWVLLCRKAQEEEGKYNDVAMLGHNPYTGKTCYFQNALYRRTDGLHVPHPGDTVASPESPQQTESLWNGLHGGMSGIQCARCHDADPIIHTPWIDGALKENGDPVLPKMGITDGFALGFNEAPYSIVDLEGQDWTMPKHIVSDEAAPCTKCHRMGDGRWARNWMRRMVGRDAVWNGLHTEEGLKFNNLFWMPPEMEGIDEHTWDESEFGKAADFIMECFNNPTDEACKWEELPPSPLFEFGDLPTIDLEGDELALEALKVLGANVFDSGDTARCDESDGACRNNRCAECHSVGKNNLKEWMNLTKRARANCNLGKDPETMTQEEARVAVNCLRAEESDENSVFAAEKVGIFSTGARYGDFRALFQKAYGDDYWLPQYIQFKQRVNMPKGTYPAISQHEYAVLLKWFESDLEGLDSQIVDPPLPTECEAVVSTQSLENHLTDMKYDGWEAVNAESGLTMFGCDSGVTDAVNCFAGATFTDHTGTWGSTKSEGVLKQVMKLGFRSSFWTRSSADGRYIGNGGGTNGGSTITDLVRGVDIKVESSYDPGFFPDNSGFIFQGGGNGAGICAQSILETTELVDYEDPACMKGTDINLYQHVARGVNGGDYFIINSQFTSDAGARAPIRIQGQFQCSIRNEIHTHDFQRCYL